VKLHKDGYEDDTEFITLANPEQFANIELVKIGASCEKIGQGDIKNFWFCGKEAKKLAHDPINAGRWANIVGRIDGLRTLYGISDLPKQVVISQDTEVNAFYAELNPGCDGPNSFDIPGLDDIESIILTTAMVKDVGDEVVNHVLTHEWGHGKDFREESCVGRSSRDDYVSVESEVYQAGGNTLVDSYIKDSVYDGHGYGHPTDNDTEMYASSFHVGTLHNAQFEKSITNLAPEIKKGLQRLVAIPITSWGNN
jgi:hypothetical protein